MDKDVNLFANTLDLVAVELQAYAKALRTDGKDAEWHWSTYGIEAQSAVFDLLRVDGHIE